MKWRSRDSNLTYILPTCSFTLTEKRKREREGSGGSGTEKQGEIGKGRRREGTPVRGRGCLLGTLEGRRQLSG